MGNRSWTSLAFIVFQMTTATLFLRPAEIFEALDKQPIYELLIFTTMALAIHQLQGHFGLRMLMLQPITICVMGVFACVMFSHLSHAYLGAVLESGEEFLKTLIYYGLLVSTVNTPKRLWWFAANVAFCGSLMVSLCVVDFLEWIDLPFIEHLMDFDDYDEEGMPIFIYRMRGTGIFQDPNDICMVITACIVLCLYFLMDQSLRFFRPLWLLPLLPLVSGLYLTQSRGGLLALGGGLFFLALASWGQRAAIVMATMAVCALPLMSSRIARMDLGSGGTADERVMMWREGFEALKSPDLLFGIGHDTYADLAGLVAHNSYIHAYVELGLVGGSFFFGCFFFIVVQLWRMQWRWDRIWHPELLRFHPYLCGVVGGWMVAMMSLSRCYVVPTYMVVGLATTYLNLVGLHTEPRAPLVMFNRYMLVKWIASSACAFIGLFLMTYVLSR